MLNYQKVRLVGGGWWLGLTRCSWETKDIGDDDPHQKHLSQVFQPPRGLFTAKVNYKSSSADPKYDPYLCG
jgi:hypothetical protein